MPAKEKNPTKVPNDLSFEEAMAKLENIIDAMEGEQLPLEELVTQYEVGSALLKHCGTFLSAAKNRIELITLTDREETEPVDGRTMADPDESNDITLI